MELEPIPVLDDSAKMQEIDKRNMLRLISELPEQYETAMGIGRSFAIEPLPGKPSVVLIAGTGDSGLAADMAQTVLADETETPVVSDHSGRLPKYVGEDALVFVVDYPGKSQSSIRILRDAMQRKAQVICITSGGKLLETASNEGAKIVKIPPGQPHRTAIGYLFAPLVVVMEKLELAEGLTEKLSHAVKLMKSTREGVRFEYPSTRNTAKQTAEALNDKLVVIYGASGYRADVAARWKSQICSNSKIPAFTGVFPDAAESDISGWEMTGAKSKSVGIVLLKDSDDKSETADLMNAAKQILGEFTVLEVELKGATTLEKMLYGLYLGDFVSYYLALLQGVNPTITESAAFMESQLVREDPSSE